MGAKHICKAITFREEEPKRKKKDEHKSFNVII